MKINKLNFIIIISLFLQANASCKHFSKEFEPNRKTFHVTADYFKQYPIYFPEEIRHYKFSYSPNLMVSKDGDSLYIIAFSKGLGSFSLVQNRDTLLDLKFNILENEKIIKAKKIISEGNKYEILNNEYADWITHLKNINEEFEGLKLPLSVDANKLIKDTIDTKQIKDKIVLINFWYFGCPPCMAELEEIKEIATNDLMDDLEIISVNKDSSFTKNRKPYYLNVYYENGKKISRYDTQYLGQIYYAYAGSSFEKQLSFHGYPLTLIIDKKGILRLAINGGMKKGFLKQQIDLIRHLD
jgi:thiol-disulfide isomerase/thioredoxin